MPLRDDLLVPVSGDNPSGPSLQYDKVFDQLKEARIEDDDSIPTGQWGRAPKKADRVLVIKLAGETLAARSKDLRLAGWYLESLLRKEGFPILPAALELLRKLEEQFWDTLHPELDEDGNADLRIGALEAAANLLAASVKAVSLARGGVNWLQYQDARAIGFEADATTDDKIEARADAIARGRMTGEDLQKAIEGTPKAFYAETEVYLAEALTAIETMDVYHEERYGSDYPSFAKLKSAIEDVKKVVTSVLNEKRKTDPDPVSVGAAEEPEEEIDDPWSRYDAAGSESAAEYGSPAAAAAPVKRAKVTPGAITDSESAYATVVACAQFLWAENHSSPVPYLLCAAVRLGETRNADIDDLSFAVAPPTATRQALRRLANETNWDELMQLCLQTLVDPCGRMWLDLQRYIWRSANENSQYSVAAAVVSTVRGLLTDKPSLRQSSLDDDTPAANAETQQWIDAEVLPPAQVESEDESQSYEAPAYVAAAPASEAVDIYKTALDVLKQGRMSEAISMIVRDSELQPSGRMRFQRRVQMAQLCLAADQAAVAYPVLLDLSAEMERRALETWEAAEMLAQPLGLLLRCMEVRKASAEDRDVIFARLCRLDPQAALNVRR